MSDPEAQSISIVIPDNPSYSQSSSRHPNEIESARASEKVLTKRDAQRSTRSKKPQNTAHHLTIEYTSRKLKNQSIEKMSRSKLDQSKSQKSQHSQKINSDQVSENKSSLQPFQSLNDYDLGTQTTINAFGNGLSHHLSTLRRTNLINILSSKNSEARTERENRLIMEILKHEPFFSIIASNYKLLYEISSKLEYKFAKQSEHIFRINEITEGYFILIRGCVELSIPERMINEAEKVMESENEKILKEIEKRNQEKEMNNKKKSKQNSNIKENKNIGTKKASRNSNSQEVNKTLDIGSESIRLTHQIPAQISSQPRSPSRNQGEDSPGTKNVQKQQAISKQKRVPAIIKTFKKASINEKISSSERVQKGSGNEKFEQSQSCKKNKQFSQNKKPSMKQASKQETFWSPTQFSLDDCSDVLSQNQFEDIEEGEQKVENGKKQGTVLEYIDKIVKTVEEGECFGEITVGEINRRATNALAKYESHMIVIKKQHYDLISRASIKSQMKVRYDFLLNLELFKKVYRYSVESFIYYITEIPCQYKTTLYQEGDEIKYVYLVKNGQFNLSKTINQNLRNKKNVSVSVVSEENAEITALKRQENKWREGVFKKIYSGEILGDCETYLKKSHYNQTCKCTSQSGSIYRIDKNLFIQKILSSQNEVVAIKKYLNSKYKNKLRYIDNFIEKQLNNQVIARILPASRSWDRNVQKRRSGIRSQTTLQTIHLQQKSKHQIASKNDFFDQFNKTFRKIPTKKRIYATCAINLKKPILNQEDQIASNRCKTAMQRSVSLNVKTEPVKEMSNSMTSKSMMIGKSETPSCIKDIVAVVNCKEQYFRNRNKSGEKQISFEFEKHKMPIFIAQKFKHLVSRLQMKKK